ncbi:MAG: hypothetical protein V2I37_06185 [Marinilabiliaceae bacterium]|jgi:hypothetical protein|nr:hypothetical protein [Marinilabiliaceae bacterium]
MKTRILLPLLLISSFSFSSLAQDPDAVSGATSSAGMASWNPMLQRAYNNDNFDNVALKPLKLTIPFVEGEISNPGYTDFGNILQREVIVKEVAEGKNGELEFKGVFNYRGYPLSDLLEDFVVDKKNKAEFPVETDLVIVISNDRGESAAFSWGEIFMSKRGKDIMLATAVAPVFPTKTDDTWPVPANCKIIAGSDFHTLRNIESPTKIEFRSFPQSFPGEKGFEPLYSASITLEKDARKIKITKIPEGLNKRSFPTAFFGLHKGFKEIKTFEGYPLKEVLEACFDFTASDLQHGILAVGAKDAYRCVYSLSEIMNRQDLESVLIIDLGEDDHGRFKIFPAAEVFADRQLKGASLAYILNIK